MIKPEQLQDVAHTLNQLIPELQAAKTTTGGQTRSERIMAPYFCSAVPGNEKAINLWLEIETTLNQWLKNNQITTINHSIVHNLTQLEHNTHLAETYCTQPTAINMLEQLQQWITRAQQLTGQNKSINELASKPEQPQTAKSILHRIRGEFPNATQAHLKTWANRGNITQYTNQYGQTCYLLTEVYAWLTRKK